MKRFEILSEMHDNMDIEPYSIGNASKNNWFLRNGNPILLSRVNDRCI